MNGTKRGASFQQLMNDMLDVLEPYVEHARLDSKPELYLLSRDIGASRIISEWIEYQRTATDRSVSAFLESAKAKHIEPVVVEQRQGKGVCPICGEPGGWGPGNVHLHCEVDQKRQKVREPILSHMKNTGPEQPEGEDYESKTG